MKNLKVLAKEYELEIIDEKISYLETLEAAKGHIREYYTSILLDLSSYIIKINIDKDINREKLKGFLDKLSEEIRTIKSAQWEKNYIQIVVKEGDPKKTAEVLKEILNRTVDFLEEEQTNSACAFCGDEDAEIKATSVIKNESEIDFICDSCHEKRVKELEEEKERIAKMRENYILGFIGAFIGASIGGILWVIMSIFGYQAEIAVIGIIIGGISGYTFFSKKMGITGSVLFVISSEIVMMCARFAEYTFKYQKFIKNEGERINFIESAKELVDYINYGPEAAKEIFFSPYFIIAFLTVIGVGVFTAKSASRYSKGIYSVKRD